MGFLTTAVIVLLVLLYGASLIFMPGVALTLTILLLIYAAVIYNRLVAIKHEVSKAWSNIDILLKQRHDELPKLVEACKQHAGFEQETLTRVMQARQQVSTALSAEDIPALGRAETDLRAGLMQLFAVAEAYPDLKASESFQHLQTRITGLESGIADRREFYNETVNINNVRIEQFPEIFIAGFFRFGPRDLLEFSEAETADVDLKALFSN